MSNQLYEITVEYAFTPSIDIVQEDGSLLSSNVPNVLLCEASLTIPAPCPSLAGAIAYGMIRNIGRPLAVLVKHTPLSDEEEKEVNTFALPLASLGILQFDDDDEQRFNTVYENMDN